MTNQNLSNRIQKAKKLQFVLTPGIEGIVFFTKGSKGDGYWLQFQRSMSTDKSASGREFKHVTYTVDCRTEDWKRAKAANHDTTSSMAPCQGNSKTVCYHCLGLMIDNAKEHGYKVVGSTDSFDNIARLRNLGDCLIEVKSASCGKSVWMVLKKVKPVTLEDNVNLMRGDKKEQEAID